MGPRVGKKQEEGSNRMNDFTAGKVAKDNCENCFSPVLTITGNGNLNSKGIIVAEEDERQGRQQFKNEPTYMKTHKSPSPLSNNFLPKNDGYEYPVPQIPLQYETTKTPKVQPKTNAKKVYQQPSYVSPSSQSNNFLPKNDGYEYPVPQNPFQYDTTKRPKVQPKTTTELFYQQPSYVNSKPIHNIGISVSNPGENGLLPSYNDKQSDIVTQQPTIPTYGTSSPNYISSPAQIYGGGITSPYAPIVSTTYSPSIISSTYSPASPSYQPAFEISPANDPPVNKYFVNTTPTPITPLVISRIPTYSSSTPFENNLKYTAKSQSSQEYGVPLAPVISTTYGPNEPRRLELNHINPSVESFSDSLSQYSPVVSTTAKPRPKYESALSIPVMTEQNSYKSPSKVYQTSLDTVADGKPKETYGVPQAPVISSLNSFEDISNAKPSYG